MAGTRALVLGGGGVTGIAWELGVLEAWADAGIDVRAADVVIGTSAGSAVAAQLGSGRPIEALVARQLDPATSEQLPAMDLDVVIEIFMESADPSLSPEERGARVGKRALEAPTVTEAVRRRIIEARLDGMGWSDLPVRITAVDAGSGVLRVFDRSSGVDLVDAVAASCAVPGVWPPVTIGDRRYVDGGVCSPTNAQLAAGFDRVLVLTPLPPTMVPAMHAELAALREQGSDARLLEADEQALQEMGPNPLDPARRSAAVQAGRRQGAAWAEDVRSFWA